MMHGGEGVAKQNRGNVRDGLDCTAKTGDDEMKE